MKTTCVDGSVSMKAYNKHTYGKTNYITSTIDNNLLFDPNTFTHISILDYEIYKISDLHKFFYVSSNWSTHKGFLFIHVNYTWWYFNDVFMGKGFTNDFTNTSLYNTWIQPY